MSIIPDCQQGLGSPALASGSFRRIQRFMAQVNLPMRTVARLIFGLLPMEKPLILVIDRTNWRFGDRYINIPMLGVSYSDVAFPLMFRMLTKGAIPILPNGSYWSGTLLTGSVRGASIACWPTGSSWGRNGWVYST